MTEPRTIILTATYDDEHGHIGWQMEGRSWMDPAVEPRLMAHDILEHHPDDDGSLEQELKALGAMLLLRGHTFRDLPRTLSADLAFQVIFYEQVKDKLEIGEPQEGDDYWSHLAEEASQFAIKEVESEFSDRDPDEPEKEIPGWLSDIKGISALLSRGYHWADELYGDAGCGDIFNDLQESLKRYFPPEYEGRQLEVTISLEPYRIWVEEYYSEEEYDEEDDD